MKKVTAQLPIGTQSRFIDVAKVASRLDLSLNVLLTVRWSDLFDSCQCHPLSEFDAPVRISRLVELHRKWITRRTHRPFAYIWVREETTQSEEHWHLALHLPTSLEEDFSNYVSQILGERRAAFSRSPTKRTKGEWAIGENGSWHLARDMHPEFRGLRLAAYLGKGEPSTRLFRGREVVNLKKPFRGGKYDVEQGEITGTAARKRRFDTSLFLKREIARGSH